MKKTHDEQALSIVVAILAQWGSTTNDKVRKKKGLKPEKATELWVKVRGGYAIIALHRGNIGMLSAVETPPPKGTLILKVSKQT